MIVFLVLLLALVAAAVAGFMRWAHWLIAGALIAVILVEMVTRFGSGLPTN